MQYFIQKVRKKNRVTRAAAVRITKLTHTTFDISLVEPGVESTESCVRQLFVVSYTRTTGILTPPWRMHRGATGVPTPGDAIEFLRFKDFRTQKIVCALLLGPMVTSTPCIRREKPKHRYSTGCEVSGIHFVFHGQSTPAGTPGCEVSGQSTPSGTPETKVKNCD